MKMMYGNVPIKSLNIKHYEMDTNSCDMVASDLQSGKTAVARGKKITGTGKCFSFASYGFMDTNLEWPIPTSINVIQIASLNNPVQLVMQLNEMKEKDFNSSQLVANVIVDGSTYPIEVSSANNMLLISCEKDIRLQVFYGKDEYA